MTHDTQKQKKSMTKTTIHSISLYEFVNMNDKFILSVMYHLFIMTWNYYFITGLETLAYEKVEFAFCFDAVRKNLHFCQIITLFTIFCIFTLNKINTTRIAVLNKINTTIPIIMCCSFSSKMLVTFYQYYNSSYNFDSNVCFKSNESVSFGLVYTVVTASYIVRLPICMGAGLLIIIIPMCIICERVCSYIFQWSKGVRFTVVGTHDNDELEDV